MIQGKLFYMALFWITDNQYYVFWKIYQNQDWETDLVIGAITESQEFISQVLESKGGRTNMCTALEELEKDGIETEKFLPDMKTGSNQKKCKKGFCFCPPDIFDKK